FPKSSTTGAGTLSIRAVPASTSIKHRSVARCSKQRNTYVMHRTTTVRALLILLLTALLAGCATAIVANRSRAMYSAESGCPEGEVSSENVDGQSAVLVRGCGYRQMYACGNGACVANGPRQPEK